MAGGRRLLGFRVGDRYVPISPASLFYLDCTFTRTIVDARLGVFRVETKRKAEQKYIGSEI
jgi:hypothetical protein